MAEQQNYMFNVDADVSQALDNLNKVAKLMQTIENLRNKGQADYFTTNQKDMDKNMRSMKQLAKEYVDMMKEMSDISKKLNDTADSMSVPEGASAEHSKLISKQKKEATDAAKVIIQQQKSIQQAYVKTLMTFREMSTYQQNYSKNFKHLFSSNDIRNLPSAKEDFGRAKGIVRSMANDSDGTKLGDVLDQIKSVTKLNRRSESVSRRGAAANYLSTQQAASFRKDYRTANTQYVKDRDTNEDELVHLGQRRSGLHDQVKRIEQNPFATQGEVDKKIAMQGEIEQIDKEWEARMELNKALEQTITGMKKYNSALQGVEQKPERGTFRGMAYERAPAIGLALTGALTAAVMGMYNKGAGLSRAMRPDEISIGQRTDTKGSLWRSQIRNGALNAGLANRLGFSGQDMLGFENNYLSNNGYDGKKDMTSAMSGQAQFSRTTGLNSSDTTDLFSTMFQTGAVKGDQVKTIQDGIIGAMKRNGMEGREKEQVKALQNLVQGVSQGRTLGNKDIMNVMGLQSILSGTGLRSLQGQQGSDLLNGMNQGIRQGINDPTVRMVMGQGTKYQGLNGRFALRKQMDKGISDVGNVQSIAKFAQSYGGNSKSSQNEAFASFVQEKLGTNITGEQAQAMMDLSRSGKLTQKNIDKVLKDNNATGSKTSKERAKQYGKSSASIDNQSDATTEKQATELYDLGEVVRKVNASMGGMPPALYAAIIALGAFTVALAGSAASFGLGRGVRVMTRGTFRNGEEVAAGGLGTKFKNFMTGKGWKGNTPSGGGPEIPPTVPKTPPAPPSDLPPGWKKTQSGIVYHEDLKSPKHTSTSSDEIIKATPSSTTKPRGAWSRTVGSWFDPNARNGGLPNTGDGGPQGPGAASRFFGRVTGGIGNAWKGTTGFLGNVGDRTVNWTQGKGFVTPGEKAKVSEAGKQGRAGFKIANGAEDVAGATKATSSIGKWFGAGKNLLGKAMLPLAVAGGAYDVLKAKKGHKGEATGKAVGSIVGGIGGAMAAAGTGAAAGAAIGSVVPVGGTIVGGLVGGAIGLGAGLLGSHVGGSVGGWVGKQFDPTKAKAAELSKSELAKADAKRKGDSAAVKQTDKNNTDVKSRTEYKKTDNLQYERQNLHTNENQLSTMQNLLNQARQQNGIIGSLTGLASAGGNGASGSGSGAPTTNTKGNKSSIWNYFAQQGYSSSAISGIMGNIGTETGGTFDPKTKQKGGPGMGLAQWTKGNGGRWDQLTAWSKKQGLDPNSMSTQLQFMQKEMTQMGLTPDKMNGMSVNQATSVFEKKYEGAGKPNMSSRNNYANQAYNQFGSAQMSPSAASKTSDSNKSVSVNSQISINLNGNQDVASQVGSNNDLKNLGAKIQQMIFGSTNYYSKEMKMT